jgi:predicted metal-dependent TIM-barrel fold hydrolase
MKTREDIIISMCMTTRHDFGLIKNTGEFGPYPFPSGMTDDEKKVLYRQMAKNADALIAIHTNNSGGTKNMIEEATKKNLLVYTKEI